MDTRLMTMTERVHCWLLVLFGEAEAGNGLLCKESCVNLSTAAGRQHVAVVRLSRL